MSYIAVDLDALGMMPAVGAASGLGAERTLYCLVRLWEWCWRQEDDMITAVHLHGFFGSQDPAILQALETFGFVSKEDGKLRVRGAERYLRVKRAQRDAGKRTSKKRWGHSSAIGELDFEGSKGSSPMAHLSVECSPTANSEQRTATSESTTKSISSTSSTVARDEQLELVRSEAQEATLVAVSAQGSANQSTPLPSPQNAPEGQLEAFRGLPEAKQDKTKAQVVEVFEHWKSAMGHPGSRLGPDKERRIKARLKEGYSVEQLCGAIDGALRDEFLMGRDPKSPRKYDGIETLLRDGSQVERLLSYLETPPVPAQMRCPNDVTDEAKEFFKNNTGDIAF